MIKEIYANIHNVVILLPRLFGNILALFPQKAELDAEVSVLLSYYGGTTQVAGVRKKESEAGRVLSHWLLLCLTNCLILQECPLGDHNCRVHLQGQRRKTICQLPSLMGQMFSPLYINSSLPVTFGWVHDGLLRHPAPLEQQGMPKAGDKAGQVEPL